MMHQEYKYKPPNSNLLIILLMIAIVVFALIYIFAG